MAKFSVPLRSLTTGAILAGCVALPAAAQEAPAAAQDAPKRTRIALGPQIVPSFPGSDRTSIRPFVDVTRARGDAPFAFEAPDESAGFSLWRGNGFAVGPSFGFEGRRTARRLGADLPRVGATFEIGGFAQYDLTDSVRLRGELRKGIGGHKGFVGNIGADYIRREKDDWLFSIGPRVTITDDRYQDAFFSIAPVDATRTGLRAYDADGGVQAVGVTAGFIKQLTPRWGVATYAKYDRLVADPGDSPVVRLFGSRNQLSGGVAATYTFGVR